MSTQTSHAGRFVWRELVTAQLPDATRFYGDLFGWSHQQLDMGGQPYVMLRNDAADADVGGAMQPMMDNVPPHWLDYITVDDVDAALAQVEALGGAAVTAAMDLPVGRFAVVQDPAGATFALFTSKTPGASDTDSRPADHTFCWSQLMTTDLDAVVPFYAALFGWEFGPMGPGMVLFSRAGKPVATAMAQPEGAGPHSHWLQYVAVDDADTATARAGELGAQVYQAPTDIPDMGRFSVLADPTGAVFALWKDFGSTPSA